MALQEIKSTEEEINDILIIKNFDIHQKCRETANGGGVAICIEKKYNKPKNN
jgi:hypothetical protein